MDISERVRTANKELFSDASILTSLSADSSIMNPQEQARIEEIIKGISRDVYPGKLLDIGTGLGNVLKISRRYFNFCLGCDLSPYLLSNLKQQFPSAPLVCCDAEALAFKSHTFNCISIFATLHHIVDYPRVIEQAASLIKKGGYLYIDHEQNYFLIRYYRIFLILTFFLMARRAKDKFMLANFHVFHSKGINPELIKKRLIGMGFREVNVKYRFTCNPRLRLSYALLLRLLKLVSRLFPFKSCYTHFHIIAKK